MKDNWISGTPNKQGNYWLRLEATDKMPSRMREHILTCYSAMCDCHKSWLNMDARHKKNIEQGFYIVTGYITLPEPPK